MAGISRKSSPTNILRRLESASILLLVIFRLIAKTKAFDQSAPLGETFIPKSSFQNLDDINFSLKINGEERQKGNSGNMIFSFDKVISYVSQFITLKIGDLIFTGTPEGVGPAKINDHFEVFIEDEKLLEFNVK